MEPLCKGDTIALVAPAHWSQRVEETRSALEENGYHVILAPNLSSKYGQFAGTDKERADAFMEMWKDPKVKALWCIKGGYGTGKILDFLDYDYIKNHPKIFIGMSDITALHIALTQKAGLVTFLGPVAHYAFDLDEYDPSSAEGVWKEISNDLSPQIYEGGKNSITLVDGVAEGVLTGGNLALLTAHIGTPYAVDTKDKILLIEDVDEKPYRIDRMLNQLKQAGALDHVKGVILAS